MAERHRKELVGIVMNKKMNNTAIVQVTRLVQHPLFQKIIRIRKKYFAHDEKQTKTGDKVRIRETKPLSKLKHWQIIEIVSAAK